MAFIAPGGLKSQASLSVSPTTGKVELVTVIKAKSAAAGDVL